jgi:FkbM family methyltransferase
VPARSRLVPRSASLAKALARRAGLEIARSGRIAASASDAFLAQREFVQRMGIAEPTIFDIGAHRGSTAARYLDLMPGASLYAFEALPSMCIELEASIGGRPTVHVINAAVADSVGSREFNVNALAATSSLLSRPTRGHRYYPSEDHLTDTIEVQTLTVDHFVSDHSIDHVDVLKLDIQGSELMALKGAERLLVEQGPLVYTETMFVPHYEGQPLLHELWSYLAEFGYTLFQLYNLRTADNGQLRYGDALFVTQDVRSLALDNWSVEP